MMLFLQFNYYPERTKAKSGGLKSLSIASCINVAAIEIYNKTRIFATCFKMIILARIYFLTFPTVIKTFPEDCCSSHRRHN